jgi:hypothetical protein
MRDLIRHKVLIAHMRDSKGAGIHMDGFEE